jgi:TetR/AcrR family transcriptional regulator
MLSSVASPELITLPQRLRFEQPSFLFIRPQRPCSSALLRLISTCAQPQGPSSGHRNGAPPTHSRLPSNERRERLIRVAVDLFSRKGFEGTTNRQIAATAGVTEAIIFRHFETREVLYTGLIDEKLNSTLTARRFASVRSVIDRNDGEAAVRSLISAIICIDKADLKFERLMLYAALEGNQIALLNMHLHQLTASILNRFRVYFLRRPKEDQFSGHGPDGALIAIAGMAQHYTRIKYIHELKGDCLSDD